MNSEIRINAYNAYNAHDEGFQKGIQQGIRQGIIKMFKFLLRMGKSRDLALQEVINQYTAQVEPNEIVSIIQDVSESGS